MNIIIIEDEKPSARRLQRMLTALNLETEIMLHSVEESVTYFQNHEHPDLIFLDIQLSDGLSFEIFEAMDIKSAVIFTTAYDEYAIKTYELEVLDYLVKPISFPRFIKAINRASKTLATTELTEKSKSIKRPFTFIKVDKKKMKIKLRSLLNTMMT